MFIFFPHCLFQNILTLELFDIDVKVDIFLDFYNDMFHKKPHIAVAYKNKYLFFLLTGK